MPLRSLAASPVQTEEVKERRTTGMDLWPVQRDSESLATLREVLPKELGPQTEGLGRPSGKLVDSGFAHLNGTRSQLSFYGDNPH